MVGHPILSAITFAITPGSCFVAVYIVQGQPSLEGCRLAGKSMVAFLQQ